MRTLIIVFAVVSAACGVSESNVGTNLADDPVAEGGELSTGSRSFVGLRQDLRRCIAPLCGGFWVHDLNRVSLSETYVSGLDFSSSGLSDADQQRVYEGLGEVVLRGKLGPKDRVFGVRPFVVSEAYRGMPGITVGAADSFFKLETVEIQCVRAPCPSMSATRVNHTAKTLFHVFDISGVGERLELKWLNKRALQDGAITSGVVVRNGDETWVQASNVFLRLPERAGPCPLSRVTLCPDGEVRTYTRTPDRCMMPAACVTPGVCAQYLPVCGEGYTLQQWASGQHGCPAFVCDPTWISE